MEMPRFFTLPFNKKTEIYRSHCFTIILLRKNPFRVFFGQEIAVRSKSFGFFNLTFLCRKFRTQETKFRLIWCFLTYQHSFRGYHALSYKMLTKFCSTSWHNQRTKTNGKNDRPRTEVLTYCSPTCANGPIPCSKEGSLTVIPLGFERSHSTCDLTIVQG